MFQCYIELLILESQVDFLRKFDGILWANFYSNPVFSQEGKVFLLVLFSVADLYLSYLYQ